jgi:hypothetical protein
MTLFFPSFLRFVLRIGSKQQLIGVGEMSEDYKYFHDKHTTTIYGAQQGSVIEATVSDLKVEEPIHSALLISPPLCHATLYSFK